MQSSITCPVSSSSILQYLLNFHKLFQLKIKEFSYMPKTANQI